MPELPEVEFAAALARDVAVGHTITSVGVLHRSQRRRLAPKVVRSLVGERVTHVERGGKTQYFRLTSGRVLVVHFRMTGDWVVDTIRDTLPAHARAFLAFEHGKRLVLDDPRALSVLHVLPPEAVLSGSLGPDAMEKAFDAAHLASTLAKRRGAIKTVLLDQRVVAGLGNIYVAEALWLARIDPRRAANRLTASRLAMLVKAIRRVLAKALRHAGRYYESGGGGGGGGGGGWSSRFAVYDREGAPCKRCGARIKRIAQGGRSTYFCARCQT